jgi:hypothetical protein
MSGTGLQRFREEKRFSEFMIWAWNLAEASIDDCIARIFGVTVDDSRSDLLFGLSFKRKLDFLKEKKFLSQDEYKKIDDFRIRRNDLFHKKPLGNYQIGFLTEKEKDEIMSLGIEAIDALSVCISRN